MARCKRFDALFPPPSSTDNPARSIDEPGNRLQTGNHVRHRTTLRRGLRNLLAWRDKTDISFVPCPTNAFLTKRTGRETLSLLVSVVHLLHR